MQPLLQQLNLLQERYVAAVNRVVEWQSQEAIDLLGRKLVEMAGCIIMGYLLLQDASSNETLFAQSARVFVSYVASLVDMNAGYIERFELADLSNYQA